MEGTGVPDFDSDMPSRSLPVISMSDVVKGAADGESAAPAVDDVLSMLKERPDLANALNGSDVRVGIIMGRWNSDIIGGLYQGVNESLVACGVNKSNVFVTYVPGAYELPVTAKLLAMSKRVDVIICLGCLIKGETMHFEYIAEAVSQGLMKVGLDTLVPTLFGVLTVLNKEQAVYRSSGEHNEGLSWGRSAVEMGLARMSALGMDKPKVAKKDSSAFVTFKEGNTTSAGSNPSPSKIGF
jgi:6,7-dimethyl-8-ribityllumazine synthase